RGVRGAGRRRAGGRRKLTPRTSEKILGVISPETADCLMREPSRCAEKVVGRNSEAFYQQASPAGRRLLFGPGANRGASPCPGSKGAIMFRTTVDDLSLFGGRTAAGPKPSFRPAVEALEERMVLSFSLSSSFFGHGSTIPVEFASSGPYSGNWSPPLKWEDVPSGTLRFA